MEEKLFWVSMASGVYALLLRTFLKKEERLSDWKLTALMHGSFWALAGGVMALLLTTYWERPDLTVRLMCGLAAAGFSLGLAWRALRNRSAKTAWDILRDDLEWADTGFSAILLAAFIMYFFVQAFKIPSGSMEKTLLIGDHLFVNKFIYGVRVPFTVKRTWRVRDVRRGDVVVFRFPTEDKKVAHYGKDFIKRAVGLPGDTVEIRDKRVLVNGQVLTEAYVNFADAFVYPREALPFDPQSQWERGALPDVIRDNFGPVTVPPGHFLVMGDNRDRSYDSRFWGPLPERYLKGKAWFVYWPFRRAKIIK